MSAQLPALQVVLPLLAALLAALVRHGGTAWLIALAASLAMPVIAFTMLMQVLDGGSISYALGGWPPPFGIEYRVDVLSAFVLLLVSIAGAVMLPYARLSVAAEIASSRRAWFYAMYLLCLSGLLGIVITGDAFNAFVFLEISSLAAYAMIAMGRDRRALFAAYQYLIMGTIGATFYVIAVGLLYTITGTLNLVDMANRFADITTMRPLFAALAFLTVGVSLKFALFPLHVWLPNAYAYAPSFTTAFLAATATKAAVYLLLRYFYSVYGIGVVFGAQPVSEILLLLSVAAMFIASLVAVFQQNIKRMLAYSSVAQIGYITLGISLANQTGLTGGIVHLFNHAMIKGALFLAVGGVVYRLGFARIGQFDGLGRRMPLTMAALVLAGLALIGTPGTAGFISKWYLALGALEKGWWWLVALIVASSLISVLYIGRVVEHAYFREPTEETRKARELPASMLIPIWVLTAATVYFGIETSLTVGVARRAAEMLLAGLR
ncbi:MAG: monovalent cation/H+ antiporter subunit D family protein [Hyphomicrobiales bacterium]|jgi:multicomponent Na+:H+ antiporter subunit D|nr:monovalent cation/H+ antiporter subunit D family protein [Hyphomicrobiales bacterium]